MADEQGRGVILQGLKELPVQVPIEILDVQSTLGVNAVMLWINLLFNAQQQQALKVGSIGTLMGLESKEITKALVRLADHGWINDEGYEIKLCIPTERSQPEKKHHQTGLDDLLDQGQKGFEWLISFWSTRVAAPSPEEMKKLLFWMEKKQMSHEVIAAAIEEMCASIDHPHFSYLEGVLRNWANEGVFTYSQLVEKPYLSKVLAHSRKPAISPEAEQKWKELFPDEFDD